MDDDDGTVGKWDEASQKQLKEVREALKKEREEAATAKAKEAEAATAKAKEAEAAITEAESLFSEIQGSKKKRSPGKKKRSPRLTGLKSLKDRWKIEDKVKLSETSGDVETKGDEIEDAISGFTSEDLGVLNSPRRNSLDSVSSSGTFYTAETNFSSDFEEPSKFFTGTKKHVISPVRTEEQMKHEEDKIKSRFEKERIRAEMSKEDYYLAIGGSKKKRRKTRKKSKSKKSKRKKRKYTKRIKKSTKRKSK